MGLFSSQRITTGKLAYSLAQSFNEGCETFAAALSRLTKNELNSSERIEVALLSAVASDYVITSLSKKNENLERVYAKFLGYIFGRENSFLNDSERNKFKDLYVTRSKEYAEIINLELDDPIPNIGNIFCEHFFDEHNKDSSSKTAVILFAGQTFSGNAIATKKFVDNVMSRYEIVEGWF